MYLYVSGAAIDTHTHTRNATERQIHFENSLFHARHTVTSVELHYYSELYSH